MARVTGFVAVVVVAAFSSIVSTQSREEPRNDLPQPYRTTRDWGQLPAGATKWGAITAVEPAPDGSIYVVHRCFTNSCAGRTEAPIVKYDANGRILKSWGEGLFIFPHGATVDRDGNLWVTDAGGQGGKGHQVFKFSSEGKVLMTLGKAGISASSPGLMDQPTDVLVAPGGDIFVTDSHRNGKNNRVVRFSKDGKFIKEWGTKGSGRGEISEPHSIAMDSRGRLFVGRSGEQPDPDLRSGRQVPRRMAAVRPPERHLHHQGRHHLRRGLGIGPERAHMSSPASRRGSASAAPGTGR